MYYKYKEAQARKQSIITPAILHELLDADYEAGKLYWKARDRKWFTTGRGMESMNSRIAGKEAFTARQTQGYAFGIILYQQFTAHRVLWAMYHNEWPEGELDHINRIRDDNRISNLRLATRFENVQNRDVVARTATGKTNIMPYTKNLIYVCIPALKIKKTFKNNELDKAVAYRDEVREAAGWPAAQDKPHSPLN